MELWVVVIVAIAIVRGLFALVVSVIRYERKKQQEYAYFCEETEKDQLFRRNIHQQQFDRRKALEAQEAQEDARTEEERQELNRLAMSELQDDRYEEFGRRFILTYG